MTRSHISHQHEVFVPAGADEAWRLTQEVARYPEWVGATIAVLEAPAHVAPGAAYVERTRVWGPVTTVGRWTVEVCDENALVQRHTCADEGGPVGGMWIEMRVTAVEGGARVSLGIGCTVSAGPFTRPLAAWLSRRLDAGCAADVRRFAGLLAADPGPVVSG